MTLFDALLEALRRAAAYNAAFEVAPVVVLWPDRERRWEALLPRLRDVLPIYTLGLYDPSNQTGPAYWLRCVVARTVPEAPPRDAMPILYLPGVGRQDLRAVEGCPPALEPLAELQYRGVFFTHRNGRDWSVPAFLQSALDIEVEAAPATREAIQRTLPRRMDVPVERLQREAPLRTVFFDALLHPDETRTLLLWLDGPDRYRASLDGNAWAAFRALCRRRYGFDPDAEGEIAAARLLGERQGAWDVVWNRFAEAPARYPAIPELLRRARPLQSSYFTAASWPQVNEEAEDQLRQALRDLRNSTASEARGDIAALEAEHRARRESVWAALGRAPLAQSLERLNELTGLTERALTGATAMDIASAYAEWGWQVDATALASIAAAETVEDREAVLAALVAIYRPWLESAARALQKAVGGAPEAYPASGPCVADPGTCLLFCDGLRFDAGRELARLLEGSGLAVSVDWRLAALPTVTGTAKPAISPVAARLEGGPDLGTKVAETGQRVTAEVLRTLLSQAGYQVLRGNDLGDPAGRGWTESGSIDASGHGESWKLARTLAGELQLVADRVRSLLAHGWRQVTVITDHGWLLVPGGLPKVSLPEQLTEIRKGRCARLKPLASTDRQAVPWFWDEGVAIALAPGIDCFESGKDYEHGGISPQECVTPVLAVRTARSTGQRVGIENVSWRGLCCVVTLGGDAPDLLVDMRVKPRDAGTSLVTEPKRPRDGTVSLLVADDSWEGEAAFVVALSAEGAVLEQEQTVVGG